MNKKELVNLKRDLEKNCISLTKFLINYCGISNKNFYDMKISHQDIKKLMPDLKRVSFDILLKDKSCFYIGSIIPVKDCYDNIVPYVNPMLEFDKVLQIDCEETKEDNIMENLVIDDTLSDYELRKLCNYLKKCNNTKEYRKALNLLKSNKDIKVKKYKREKYNIKKGIKEDEKY